MVKNKSEEGAYNKFEREILRAIYRERRYLNISEISRLTGISWSTVKKYVTKLIKSGELEVEDGKITSGEESEENE